MVIYGENHGDIFEYLATSMVTIFPWSFQEPKLEVATISKAYAFGICKWISPQNTASYGTVPAF